MGYDRRKDGLRNDGSKGHVLVVDDAPFMTKQLTQILTTDGYVVSGVAHDGHTALEMYKTLHPDIDLVTLDITMPKLDGISTLEQIMEFDKDAHVVMITANGHGATLKRALTGGAKNFITKPLQFDAVVQCIESATRGLEKQNGK